MALQGLLCVGDLRPSSTRRLDLRSASDARGTKAVFTAHENAPAGLHEREANGEVGCVRPRHELVRGIYKLKPPPVRCMTFSWSRAIRPRRQASGCLSARCTCGEAVRSPDERSEELCEAKSQEGAREPRRGRKGPSAHPSPQPNTMASFALFAAKPTDRGSPKGSGR